MVITLLYLYIRLCIFLIKSFGLSAFYTVFFYVIKKIYKNFGFTSYVIELLDYAQKRTIIKIKKIKIDHFHPVYSFVSPS